MAADIKLILAIDKGVKYIKKRFETSKKGGPPLFIVLNLNIPMAVKINIRIQNKANGHALDN